MNNPPLPPAGSLIPVEDHPVPEWLSNWMALHGAHAKWAKGRGCWVVFLTKHANPKWVSYYSDWGIETFLEHVGIEMDKS